MPAIARTSEVTPSEDEFKTLWRLLSPESVDGGSALGAAAAVVAYKHREPHLEPTDEQLGGAHGTSEFHYVLSGNGVVAEKGGIRSAVATGDAFVIRAGVRHAIWASGEEPVVTFCVALRSANGDTGHEHGSHDHGHAGHRH